MKRIIIFLTAVMISYSAVGQIKVACIGNSITYGSTIENPQENSYPSQLQKMLGEGYLVGNFGKPGATLLCHGHRPYNLQQEYIEALGFKPDIAVFHLGINDTDPRDWPNYGDEFVRDYLSLIDSVKSTNPAMRIIIARMTPIKSGHHRFNSGTKQWHAKIQEAIETVAEISGSELIDFYQPLIANEQYYNDDVHPSKEGATILAKTVYGAITGKWGGLRMSPLYGNGMVIQMGQPIIVEGYSDAEKKIEVRFLGIKKETISDKNGNWKVEFPTQTKSSTGLSMTISDAENKFEFKDVCIGEVWLCSGQSNMEFKLRNALNEELETIDDPKLRLFHMKPLWDTGINGPWSEGACDSVNRMIYFDYSGWMSCNGKNVADFSAVAYHFGKMLRDSLQVPVGIICNATGGSSQESWIDRNTLEEKLPAILSNWTENDYTQQWCRERAQKNMEKRKDKWLHHPFEPCYLFDVGIRPLGHPQIRGVVWYQGESNAHCAETYETLFTLFVSSWRSWFGNEKLPIYYAQLSSMERPSWCSFRDTQRRLMDSIENIGMAVTSDLGEQYDVHPKNKKPVGERLARWALANNYGFDCTPSGPLVESVSYNGNSATITFRFANGLHPSNGELKGFEVATYDGIYKTVDGKISGNTIILESDSDIRYIRYGWKPFTDANLVNSDNLPASTFKTATPLR